MYQIKVSTGKTYNIQIGSGLFEKLPALFEERYHGRKLALVSDNRVYDIYGGDFTQSLRNVGFDVATIVFNEGEQNKNLNTLAQIYQKLADSSFTRSDYIIALGGGVTGDMAGLAAATFLRGMGFIQIPTTLLAMVDSSIGGKVAVDLPQGKNLVGAFYQPDAVYTDPLLLKTLDDRRFSDGMAELLKHGFIYDGSFCRQLTEYSGRSDIEKNLDEIIRKSCDIKRIVVEQDECDNGIRQILNFGHTIGHAIEKVQNFNGMTHGEAISAGMVLITRITEKSGLTEKGTSIRIKNILGRFGLPTELPDDIDKKGLLEALKIDKKARSGNITIVYLDKMGCSKLMSLTLEELEDRLNGELND